MNWYVIIAVVLFVILCPCVSYIIIHKRIQPWIWTGGIFLMLNNGTMLPFILKEDKYHSEYVSTIPSNLSAIGLHFAGAERNLMPYINCNHHSFRKRKRCVLLMKAVSGNEGVDALFPCPLESKHPNIFVYIESPFYFKLARNMGSYFYRELVIEGLFRD